MREENLLPGRNGHRLTQRDFALNTQPKRTPPFFHAEPLFPKRKKPQKKAILLSDGWGLGP